VFRKGLSLTELREKLRQEAKSQAEAKARMSARLTKDHEPATPSNSKKSQIPSAVRKDGSPIPPLSSILNLSRVFASPHTTDQVSALWTAYHAARTGGGYVCASIPLESYERMTQVAVRYPSFVVPVPRQGAIPDTNNTGPSNETDPACEFYFMQWAFHDSPPVPSAADNDDIDSLLSGSLHHSPTQRGIISNPRTSTVLFTPLREYKLRGTFATPYLVLTHYTDLARTHGVVLLRGEITPYSAASAAGTAIQGVEGQNLLTQHDVHRLAMALQRFYLWDQGKDDAERLLRLFHETPEQFDWKELLKYAEVGV